MRVNVARIIIFIGDLLIPVNHLQKFELGKNLRHPTLQLAQDKPYYFNLHLCIYLSLLDLAKRFVKMIHVPRNCIPEIFQLLKTLVSFGRLSKLHQRIHWLDITTVDSEIFGNLKVEDLNKIVNAFLDLKYRGRLSSKMSHHFSDGGVYFLMRVNVLFDEDVHLFLETFDFFRILGWKYWLVGLWDFEH